MRILLPIQGWLKALIGLFPPGLDQRLRHYHFNERRDQCQGKKKKKKTSKSHTPRTGLVIPTGSHPNPRKHDQMPVAALLPSWHGCALLDDAQSWGMGEKGGAKATSIHPNPCASSIVIKPQLEHGCPDGTSPASGPSSQLWPCHSHPWIRAVGLYAAFALLKSKSLAQDFCSFSLLSN